MTKGADDRSIVYALTLWTLFQYGVPLAGLVADRSFSPSAAEVNPYKYHGFFTLVLRGGLQYEEAESISDGHQIL